MQSFSFYTIFLLSTILGLSGCAIEDDFGRFHTPHMKERAADVVGSIQEHTGLFSKDAAYHIPLSNEEHTLRQTYKHFSKPFLANPRLRRPLDHQTFPKHGSGLSFREDFNHKIRADRLWISRFDRAIGQVISHDMQRYDVIASSYEVTDNDSRYIRVRIRENRGVVMRVLQLLDKRVSDYDQAIGYARLQYPERELTMLGGSMDKLRTQIALLKGKYETYVYQRATKSEYQDYKTEAY